MFFFEKAVMLNEIELYTHSSSIVMFTTLD